jgi:sec-independent protein translocase protein TatB
LTASNTVLYDASRGQKGFLDQMLSIPHMIIVFIVALVVFGPQKLPELARTLGKLMAEFRKASGDFKSAFEEEMRDLDRQAAMVERRKAAEAAAASAAAEPSQPASLGTAANIETPSIMPPADSRTTEALVVTPVAESIARTTEDSPAAETDPPSSSTSENSPHDTQQPV